MPRSSRRPVPERSGQEPPSGRTRSLGNAQSWRPYLFRTRDIVDSSPSAFLNAYELEDRLAESYLVAIHERLAGSESLLAPLDDQEGPVRALEVEVDVGGALALELSVLRRNLGVGECDAAFCPSTDRHLVANLKLAALICAALHE